MSQRVSTILSCLEEKIASNSVGSVPGSVVVANHRALDKQRN